MGGKGGTKRRRLDEELVSQGFFPTTADALRAVLAGEVSTSDRRMSSAGERVPQGIELHVRGRDRYVSRGGLKLEHAFRELGLDAKGAFCLDVGCSTGGFTDCLLRHGAAEVVAVDVGRAQFDWSLRQDARVRLMERTNICDLPALRPELVDSFDVVVCDVSFTSILRVLPAMHELMRDGATLLTLVKPQFEAARSEVGEGGIVRDEEVRRAVLARVEDACRERGLTVVGTCESPIRGSKGNVEYLLMAVNTPAAAEESQS